MPINLDKLLRTNISNCFRDVASEAAVLETLGNPLSKHGVYMFADVMRTRAKKYGTELKTETIGKLLK